MTTSAERRREFLFFTASYIIFVFIIFNTVIWLLYASKSTSSEREDGKGTIKACKNDPSTLFERKHFAMFKETRKLGKSIATIRDQLICSDLKGVYINDMPWDVDKVST